MAVETIKETYTGQIREVTIGTGDKAVTIGGAKVLPFHKWEGETGQKPKIAIEVYDEVSNWSENALEPFKDVADDVAAWAKKNQDQYKADLIALQLVSTDPNGTDAGADEAAETTKKVLDAIQVPLIVYGSGNAKKDEKVLKKVAEVAHGQNIALGPAQEENYKVVAAAAMGYNHKVIALSPIDINIAKQLNILITQMGLDAGNIIMDPTTGALGYGLEYSYTIMERLRLAALQQNDQMTNMPMITNLGLEVWRRKETKVEEPAWGDVATRAILWETITANTLMLAGADVLVMRHPEAIKTIRQMIEKY